MTNFVVEPQIWAEQNFGDCELGDARRTRRLVQIAEQAAARPDGSTPDQTECWGDCKAVYRLMDCDDVSHAVLIAPHCEQTRQACPPGSLMLILNDTTEIDFGRSAPGLGPLGKPDDKGRRKSRGFFLHTGLMRDAASGVMTGLAGQLVFYRRPKPPKKVANTTKRLDPNRESVAWGKLIDQIGPPPSDVKWLHVCDRGADDDEVFLRAFLNDCSWVIRTARLNRNVLTVEGQATTIEELLAKTLVASRQRREIPRQEGRAARTAEVAVRFSPLRVPAPRRSNKWIREHTPKQPLAMWVVELTEINPPADAEPLHWVLLTSEEVTSTEQALTIVAHYQKRWGVEEYHKALKTGCHVEERQYQTSQRLERVTGLNAVLAMRLLQMRTIAQQTPDLPAEKVVPKKWVRMLATARQKNATGMTIHEFVRLLGGLGGHLGRKRDGAPGWITLWRGLEKLLLLLRGAQLASKRCG